MPQVTQSRLIGKDILPLNERIGSRTAPWTPIITTAAWEYCLPHGSQTTDSWRSEPRIGDNFTNDEIREFLDTTRNGFVEYTDPRFDTGHAFYTTKTSWSLSHPNMSVAMKRSYDGVFQEARGPLIPDCITTSGGINPYPAEVRIPTDIIKSRGAAAIAASAPTQSPASLATFLGELTEGLPRVVGAGLLESKARAFSALGGEYLNVQFGWKPFISDLKKLFKEVVHSHEIIKQFTRDSGRVVRRRHAFPTQKTKSSSTKNCRMWGLGSGSWNSYQSGKSLPCTIEDYTETDVWFSGAFTYHLPVSDDLLSRLERHAAEADRLLGIEFTPAVLWELTPWSWLVDWFLDIGSLLSTASLLSSDGLVMRYGYLMQHTRANKTYRVSDGAALINGFKTGPVTVTLRRETKERVKATPFGFGLSLTGLSGRQWAILGALGMTKAPGILP